MIGRIKDAATRVSKLLASAPRRATTLDGLEERRLFAGAFGMVVADNNPNNVGRNSAMMKELGVTSVRLWTSVNDWNHRRFEASMQRAIDYANKGFDVTLIINTGKGRVPDPAKVKGWFEWATSNTALKNAVDRWQIGNEPDHKQYWNGSKSQYINNFLKPASEVLRSRGEKVVSAGPSWNPEDVREFINLGMLNYVDYVGYHPYANSVKLQEQRIREVNAVVAGRKPIVATEWNVYEGTSSASAWSAAVGKALPNVRGGFAISYYFNLVAGHPSRAGYAGVITKSGAKTPFFHALKSAARNGGTPVEPSKPSEPAPTKPSTPTPTPSKPATNKPIVAKPSTPATPKPTPSKPATPVVSKPASPKPVITRITLFNADTDKAIPGFIDLDHNDTIDLADVGTRNIAIVANTGNARAVKFRFNGQTSFADARPFASFGTRDTDNLVGLKLEPGSYMLHTTATENRNGTGRSATTSLRLNVVNSANTASAAVLPPAITGFQLQNAVTGAVIPGYERLTASTLLRTGALPTHIRVVAVTSSTTDSVTFAGAVVNETQNDRPFRSSVIKVKRGKIYIEATAYGADNRRGTVGNTLGFTLRFA